MQGRTKYLTKSKQAIWKYIKKINGNFSSQELYEMMINNNEKIGLTTIYRFLEELEKNNELKKSFDDRNIATYQYLEKCNHVNHFYLKCNKCGSLIHIDCDCIVELQKHILVNHQFRTDNKNIIISGLCENCLGGN